jgi:hypothetical protein
VGGFQLSDAVVLELVVVGVVDRLVVVGVVDGLVVVGVVDGVVVVGVVDGVVGAVVVVDVVGELVVANLTVSASTRPPVYWLCVKASMLLPVLQAETGTGI